MLERVAAARALQHLVVRQVLRVQLALVGLAQVVEGALQLLAALAHEDRRERQVLLGRDVEVERRADLQAAARVLRVVGREKAGLAPVLEREAHRWQREQRGIHQAQAHVARLAFLGPVVELELARLDDPAVLPRPAGGEARLVQPQPVLAEEFDALGAAARRRLAVHEERRLLEHAGIVLRVVAQPRAEEPADAALQAHAAVGFDAAEFLVVAQELAVDRQVLALELDTAARGDLQFGHALDLLGVDRGRALGPAAAARARVAAQSRASGLAMARAPATTRASRPQAGSAALQAGPQSSASDERGQERTEKFAEGKSDHISRAKSVIIRRKSQWISDSSSSSAGSARSSPQNAYTLAPASADASFRRYWRARFGDGRSFIVMDAPPDKEDCRPFLQVAGLFAAAGAHVPAIHAQDLDAGFLLLEDLGEATFLDCLNRGDDPQPLYAAATDALIRIQQASRPGVLPDYDRALLERELNLFPDWYLARELRRELAPRRAGGAARGLRRAARQQPRAAARVRAPRLPFAQPDAQRSAAGRAGFPGRGLRPDHLRPGFAAARRLRELGRGAGARLGGALLGEGAQGRPAGARRLRGFLPRLRVDGRAAAAESGRHLRAPLPPRRQAALSRRHPARARLPARGLPPLPGTRAARAPAGFASPRHEGA